LELQAHTLYLCGVPIGNYKDITLRVLGALEKADVIFCEDTRVTGALLKEFNIPKKRLESYHDHNEAAAADQILSELQSGQKVILVTDAGMPTVSDPGYDAVNLALKAGIKVECLPGVSASVTALAMSGLPSERFYFLGFVPKKSKEAFFQSMPMDHSIVLFESPERLVDTLEVLKSINPERMLFVGRELTKIHEESFRGNVAKVLEHFSSKTILGELTLVLSPVREVAAGLKPEIKKLATALVEKGLKNSEIAALIANTLGVSKNLLYDYLEETNPKERT
jgi:16S rRNA (cytidine1402-2'-O)-methyltransferase